MIKEYINHIRWKYFTNNKAGSIAQALYPEIQDIHEKIKED